ncbi:SDR family oxidoreductase [Agrobacterium vitis]|nr:SDR family oxidoreductase [Allorhizobium ampelinum]
MQQACRLGKTTRFHHPRENLNLADLATEAGANVVTAAVPKIDILINNLGIYESKDFSDITDDDWRRFFEINVLSGVRLSRHYLPGMLARNWGRIIFISSESGVLVPPNMIHYGMTKTAQLAIASDPNLSADAMESEYFAKERPRSLIQRMIEPEEIANLVAYVASPLSAATNGAALRVDGGITPTIV